MLVKHSAYAIVCDGCNRDMNYDRRENEYYRNGFFWGLDPEETEESAKEAGWTFKDGKHYCEECSERYK